MVGYDNRENEMKNLARLALFFSICLVLSFLLSGALRFLALWIDTARMVPMEGEQSGSLVSAMNQALSMAVYSSILLTLSYTARRKIAKPLSIIAVVILSCAFTAGLSLGMRQLRSFEFALSAVPVIRAKPGLILSRNDTSMVLLRDSSDIRGPRVVSIPDRPLIYQETPRGPDGASLALPSLPFSSGTPWFIESMLIDFKLSAAEIGSRLGQGLVPFALYAGALILLLGSLRFILELSNWPLANLFLGAVAFRAVLALETFLNARETGLLIASFLGNRLPVSFITPLAFGGLAVLILLYTILTSLARGKGDADA
jgi:hypothetical protein